MEGSRIGLTLKYQKKKPHRGSFPYLTVYTASQRKPSKETVHFRYEAQRVNTKIMNLGTFRRDNRELITEQTVPFFFFFDCVHVCAGTRRLQCACGSQGVSEQLVHAFRLVQARSLLWFLILFCAESFRLAPSSQAPGGSVHLASHWRY